MTRFRSVLAATFTALLVLAPASLARSEGSVPAEGSVPSEVAAYVADGSLVAQLNDVYGVNAEGDGIDFDDTTKLGVIERVHVWSDELREGEETDHPLDLLNEWVVPITITDVPVGLATIWINPATVRPELALFQADPDLATALSAVADGSSLVHDVESAAWLALAADGTLTPLVPGTTGLSTPVPIDDVALLPAAGGPAPEGGDPGTGVGFAVAVVLFLLAVIVVALVLPGLREKKKSDADAEQNSDESDAEATPAAELEAASVAEIEPAAEVEPEPEEPAKKPAVRKKKAPPPAE
ncbi:hypothetical protein [Pseudolysinimonas sp.]|uniref:hypothetical protein n=1 Tax=Pseudolysinimonas sp. TaxID=2680009 RepID=UPI00286AC2A5|nr:hypothetical protein [Pseudolysinimonas sp.]